jgi:WD40 repeat protein
MFSYDEFKGHKGPVTCLYTRTSKTLISGSDDKTVRVWNTNTHKTVKCFHGCFPTGIEAVGQHTANDNIIFVASGNVLYSFDLRGDSLLNSTPLSSLSSSSFSSNTDRSNTIPWEDINCFAINESERLIAVSDDSSNIMLIPFEIDGQLLPSTKTLSRVHTNIVGDLAFNPNSRRKELLSGGFDCSVCVWDLDRGRPNKSSQFQVFESVESGNQVVNPPFVQCVGYLSEGKFAISALGDGSVR